MWSLSLLNGYQTVQWCTKDTAWRKPKGYLPVPSFIHDSSREAELCCIWQNIVQFKNLNAVVRWQQLLRYAEQGIQANATLIFIWKSKMYRLIPLDRCLLNGKPRYQTVSFCGYRKAQFGRDIGSSSSPVLYSLQWAVVTGSFWLLCVIFPCHMPHSPQQYL